MPDSQATVLVLDTDDVARAAVEGALRRQGFNVKGFGNPDLAFDAATAGPFHVMVISDKQVVLDAPGFCGGWRRRMSAHQR